MTHLFYFKKGARSSESIKNKIKFSKMEYLTLLLETF